MVDPFQNVSCFITYKADRRTAEQAEAMMDPLQKSLEHCTVSSHFEVWVDTEGRHYWIPVQMISQLSKRHTRVMSR